ncbi:MAG: hypothetical protein ACOY40_02720 [Bacillota bacterium]
MRKVISGLLAVFLLLAMTRPALAAIGDQPAEQWNLQGDIRAEKDIEGQMFSIFSLSSMAVAPGAVAASGPFGVLVVGAGAASAGMAQIASPENAIWENWPEGRYVFHHAPPDKFPGLGVMAEKALYSTVEFMANMFFSITKTLVRISNNIMVLAFHTSIISGMIGWVSEGMAEIFSPGSDLAQIMISIGLIILLVYGISSILRGQAMSALSALLVAVLAVGGVFFFIANARQIISKTAEATDSLAGVFLATTGRYTFAGQRVNIDDPVDRGLVAAGQTTWQLIVAKPWALAQFGTIDESRLTLTQGEYDILNKSVFPRESQDKIKPGMRLDTLLLGSTGEGRDAVAEALGRLNKKYLWVFDGKDIDHGSHEGTMVGFSPGSATQHLKTALFTLLPAVGFALLAAFVGLSIVICQVILAPLLLFLPLPLFAMMVPNAGWSFAAKYFRTLLGFFMVKLVYGLYLSLVLVTGTAFSNALINHNLGAAMVVAALIFFAAAIYRKKFLNMVLESVQNKALNYRSNIPLEKIMAANTALARKLGITDILSDWAFSRRRGGDGDDKHDNYGGGANQPPPPPGGGWPEISVPGPGGYRRSGNRHGYTTIDIDPEAGRDKAWEGQPPKDYPFKGLPEGGSGESGRDAIVRSPGPRDSGGILDVARAVPRGAGSAAGVAKADVGAAAGKGTGATGAAGSAGTAVGAMGVAAAVGAAIVGKANDFLEGEVQTVTHASGVGASKVGEAVAPGPTSVMPVSVIPATAPANQEGLSGASPGKTEAGIKNGNLTEGPKHFSKTSPGPYKGASVSKQEERRVEAGRPRQNEHDQTFSHHRNNPPVPGKTKKLPYIPRSRLR